MFEVILPLSPDELGPCGLGCTVLVEKADVYPVCSVTFPSLVMATRHSPPSPNGQQSSQDMMVQGK